MKKIVVLISFLIFSVLMVFGEAYWLVNGGQEKLMAVSEVNDDGVVLGESDEVADSEVESEVVIADARPMIIKKYLEKYKSPLLSYADLIFEVSQDYGFEYYWIVAIAQQESNLCKKIPVDSYNCWGYGIHSKGTLRFPDYETAIKSYAEYLKRVYFDKELNTAELIMRKYAPNSNGSWAFGVNQFIDEMESGKF